MFPWLHSWCARDRGRCLTNDIPSNCSVLGRSSHFIKGDSVALALIASSAKRGMMAVIQRARNLDCWVARPKQKVGQSAGQFLTFVVAGRIMMLTSRLEQLD